MRSKRQSQIVEMLRESRMVKSVDLSEKFGVSMETIRRDLEELEEEGILSRFHGGATLRQMYGVEPGYEGREIKNYEEKRQIGKAAASLVQEGDTIIIDVGTTTLEMAKNLGDIKNLTVFTNSIPVVLELVKNQNIRIFMLGGEIRQGEISSSGFLAEAQIRHFNVDKLFMGIGGISIEKGVCDYHVSEANLRRSFIQQSHLKIGLADYSKMGVTALNKICDIQDLDAVVTDSRADRQLVNRMRSLGMTVILAGEEADAAQSV